MGQKKYLDNPIVHASFADHNGIVADGVRIIIFLTPAPTCSLCCCLPIEGVAAPLIPLDQRIYKDSHSSAHRPVLSLRLRVEHTAAGETEVSCLCILVRGIFCVRCYLVSQKKTLAKTIGETTDRVEDMEDVKQ